MRKFTTLNSLKKMQMALISTMMLLGFFIHTGQAQTCPLACNDNVQVTLDTNCLAVITPDMVLEAPGAGCSYEVVVKDLNGNVIPGDSITAEYVGQTLPVAVYLGSNSCWGTIKIEDKLPPVVNCPPADTVYCHEFPGPDNYLWPTAGVAVDACGDVTMHIVNTEWVDLPCDTVGYSGIWRRSVYWTDPSGNISDTCVLEVYLKRLSCADVVFPSDTIFNCFDYQDNKSLTDPSHAGMPSFNGRPLFFPNSTYSKKYYACEIEISYTDDTLEICPGSFKILRKWLCLDWCIPTGANNPRFEYQIVKIKDGGLIVSAPGNCPEDDNIHCNGDLDCIDDYSDLVGMNYWSCKSKKFYLPDPFSDPRFSVQACSKASLTKIGVKVARNPEVCAGATYPERFDLTHYDAVKKLWYAEDLPPGYNWFVYHIEDECGNSTEAKYDVYVYDDVPPNPVCDKHTVVALNQDGIAKLYATSVDDGSTDNCGIDSFAVRRMNDNCHIPANLIFGDFVEFCCEDLMTGPHLVVLKVIDKRGNENTCMVEVEVQDKLPPIVTCPPDVTVPCDFDLSDLSIFGTIRNAGKNEKRQKLGAAGIKGLTWSVPLADRIDGTYNDNALCGLSDTVRVTKRDYDCHNNIGWVKRTFTVTDKSGNSASCTQTITIRETGKRFSMDPRKWKAVPDVTLTDGCASDYDLTPKAGTKWGIMTPEIAAGNARGCYTLAVNYTDKRFTLGSDACIKIIREWTVIDWCQVDKNNIVCGATGVWCHTQILKVVDNTPPVFACNNVTVDIKNDYDCLSDNITGRRKVDITAEANDECAKDKLKWSYWIEKKVTENQCRAGRHDGKGTWEKVNHGSKNTISQYFTFGEYRIWWQVEDQCGNVSECKWRYFDVLDEKKPTPYCRDGINTVIMPSSKSLAIWAKDFNLGSYDNCPENLNVRFALYHPASGRWSNTKGDFVLDCSMIGLQKFWMYVYDQCGNKDYCEVTLDLQDPNGICDGATLQMVSGVVKDIEGNPMKSVKVVLKDQTNNVVKTVKTEENGNYFHTQLETGHDFWIQPQYDKDPLKGVNTRDLVAIQLHLLGKRDLSKPEYYIAADANNDSKISTSDIVSLRKMILGKENAFKNDQQSWRFVPKSFTFDDPLNPFPFADYLLFQGLKENKVDADFNAIKIGDLTGEAYHNLSGTKVRSDDAHFSAIDREFKAGETVDMAIRVEDLDVITGGQYTLKFNPLVLAFENVESDVITLNDNNFNFSQLDQGIINASWISTQTNDLSGKVLFTIRFIALDKGTLSQSVRINSDILSAEVYDNDLNVYDIKLRFANNNEDNVFALYQNKPNPFSNMTTIGFSLPKNSAVKLTVYDMSGKVLKIIRGQYSKGYNEINIDQRQLNTAGILYYQLDADNNTATRKMVLLR